jgi:carbamoyl-phosphate synthase large subunit
MRDIQNSQISVHIVGSSSDSFVLARSLADKNYLIPRADAGAAYIEAINRIAAAEQIDLIMPNNDVEVAPISAHRDQLDADTFLPSHETIELCQDKLILNLHLSRNGIRVAQTYLLNSADEADEVFSRFERSDLLWCRMRKGSGSKGSLPVRDPDQLRFWVQYWRDMREIPENMFLVCEYLPGRDYAFQSLWKDGELVIAKTCQRLSYLFGATLPSGSSSTPSIGKLVNNPRVNEICTKSVLAVDPKATGMFCIDLKENQEGNPCVTEINIGRFFMITPAFDSVGRHNMAELYLRLAFGEDVAVHVNERFSDVGSDETFLVREIDNEPMVMTTDEIESSYISLL